MFDGVRPIIRLASAPTASGRPSLMSTATTEGSLSTMPRPRTYTSVLAVPRSTAMSRPSRERRLSAISGISRELRLDAGGVRRRWRWPHRLRDAEGVHKAEGDTHPPHLHICACVVRLTPEQAPEAVRLRTRPRARTQVGARSGKKSAISRAADSGESDPCTRFSVVSIPKSPRMVPGSASAGLVAPIMRRTTT